MRFREPASRLPSADVSAPHANLGLLVGRMRGWRISPEHFGERRGLVIHHRPRRVVRSDRRKVAPPQVVGGRGCRQSCSPGEGATDL
jgi:hypothetical protein